MKKISYLSLIIVMLIALTGCGDKKEEKQEEQPKQSCEEKLLNGDYSCFIGTYTSNDTNYKTITIDKDGVNIDYNRMSDGQKDGRAKLEDIKEENGIYILKYDIGYFKGQQSSNFRIVPIGIDYETKNDWCEKCESNEDNCRYEKPTEDYDYVLGTCYYTTDKEKVRIIASGGLGGSIIYYKD